MTFVTQLCFPFTFDPELLKADLEKVLKHNWSEHYNKGAYSGNWTSIALLAPGGNANNINAMPSEQSPLLETELLHECPTFKRILDEFPFEKISARLLCLEVGAKIKPHRDNCLGYEDGVFRMHIPIVTNAEVEFVLAGERIVMEEGTCWYINANEEHSVANRGSENRVHFVIDGVRNAWTDELFFAQAPESSFERPPVPISEEQKMRMIAELERLGTPVALELIRTLKESD
ncbi:MAG: aspartyl/asparaginyl beta-hydroxylase domain-containing protein [Fluviicola sp.]|nr:aspartyl/asparaginyl beta-hydroxylase domain-containing protein [Fluviicola sp.]